MATPVTLSTVPAQTPYIQYVATSGQTVFPYPFEITQDSDLVVVANGVTLATDSGYAVSGVGSSTGGNVTFTSGRAAGDIITLYRDIAISRVSQIAQNSGFSSAAFNNEFNNIYLLLQQLQADIMQCIQIPNTNYPAPVTTLPPGTYANKYLAFDAFGNPTPALLTSSGSITQALIAGLLSPQTQAEINAGITPAALQYTASPVYDMRRYGIQPNGADNTATVQAVYNMAKVTGGTMVFPNGDWAFYLDISGTGHQQVFIDGQGSTFRPFTSNPTNSCIVYANNSASAFSDTYVRFRNVVFDSSLYSAQETPAVNYNVYHSYAASRFYNCQMQFALTAGYYSLFGQYAEFWDCRIQDCNHSATTAGVILDSNTLAASTNEVNFHRCEFFSNAVGAWLKGAQKTRFLNCTFQGNSNSGAGAIVLDGDAADTSTSGTDLIGCWWELNGTTPDIYEALAFNTNMIGCLFWGTGGAPTITFTHCSGICFFGCNWPGGGTININHPSANTDCASLYWRMNQNGTVGDMVPTLSITHNGSYSIDMHVSGSFTGTLTGCTTSPTVGFNYTIEGSMVQLKIPHGSPTLVGTSNSTACTVTGLPSVISPLTQVFGLLPWLEDNGANFSDRCGIAAGGTTLTLYKNGSATGFTNTGSKGINDQGVFAYPLYT